MKRVMLIKPLPHNESIEGVAEFNQQFSVGSIFNLEINNNLEVINSKDASAGYLKLNTDNYPKLDPFMDKHKFWLSHEELTCFKVFYRT